MTPMIDEPITINGEKFLKFEWLGMESEIQEKIPFSIPQGCYLAGGAVLSIMSNQPINDYDFYFTNLKSKEHFIKQNELKESPSASPLKYNLNWVKNFKKPKTDVMFENKIQIIENVFFDIKQIFNSFDFKICQFAYDGVNVIGTHSAYRNYLNDTLTINNLPMDHNDANLELLLFRIQKYVKKGFTMPQKTIKELTQYMENISDDKQKSKKSFFENL